jgi:hypothetical protein
LLHAAAVRNMLSGTNRAAASARGVAGCIAAWCFLCSNPAKNEG